MGRIVGIVVVAAVGAIWYVAANGMGNDYRPLGAGGPVLSGRQIVLIAAAVLLGLVCLGTGVMRSSLSTMLAGIVLLICAGSALWNVAQSSAVLADDVPLGEDVEAAEACYRMLEDSPELQRGTLSSRERTAREFADTAVRASSPEWADAYRDCSAGFGAWVREHAR